MFFGAGSIRRFLIPRTNNRLPCLPGVSKSFHSIPIIDISPFVDDGGSQSCKDQVAQELHAACCEVGFFYIKGHGVHSSITNRAIDFSSRFFQLPLDVKNEISINQSPSFRGYQRIGENITQYKADFHEGLDFYKELRDDHPVVKAGMYRLAGKNQWPCERTTLEGGQDVSGYREFFETVYVPEMLRVGNTVMRAIALGLSLPERYFEPMYDESYWVMRAIRYPPAPEPSPVSVEQSHASTDAGGDEGMELGCGEHCDYGCLTIINQPDDVGGALQARNAAGDWIPADPIPGAFVMNIGDMLHLWSGGLYQSTPHRVLRPAPGRGDRISIPFFFEPNYDAVISPVETCVETAAKAVASGERSEDYFSSVMYGDHLWGKNSRNFVAVVDDPADDDDQHQEVAR